MITELPEKAMTQEERLETWAKARRAVDDLKDLIQKGNSVSFSKILRSFSELETEIDKLNWDNAARIVYKGPTP